MALSHCKLIEIPKITDLRGNISFIEGRKQIPFDINRIYYIFDVPNGADRGSHAHKNLDQLFLAMSGSFDIVLDDGKSKKKFHLNRPYVGLYVCSMIWRELSNFSSGAVCMVLASAYYDEGDYIRDYEEFLTKAKQRH